LCVLRLHSRAWLLCITPLDLLCQCHAPPLLPHPPCHQRYTSAGKDIAVLSESERFVASLAAVPRAGQRLACWGLRYVAAEKHATALATLQVGAGARGGGGGGRGGGEGRQRDRREAEDGERVRGQVGGRGGEAGLMWRVGQQGGKRAEC
jgi:hypothetical protein